MRRLIVCCLMSAVCCVVSCQKKSASTPAPVPAKKATAPAPAAAAIPEDLSKEKVNEAIPLQVKVLERSDLGSRLGADGNVMVSQRSFKRGEPVYVSMWLKESPGGLQTSVLFTDEHGKQIAWLKKSMHGEKSVTFTLDTTHLDPGQYHAQLYWGLNIEHDYDFTVEVARAAPSKKKG